MAEVTTPTEDAATVVKLLAASQPDIVRASQKDETYIEQYVEATREVVRRLAGPFRSLQYARESKLLALLLYHGLTTGLGQPTLGEEYCAMQQQTAVNGHPPGPRRRLLLALLLSVGPYVTDRLAAQLDSAAEEAAEAEAAGAGDVDAAAAAAMAAAAAEAVTGAKGGSPSRLGDEAGPQGDDGEVDQAEGEPRWASGRQAGGGPGTAVVAAAGLGAGGRQQRLARRDCGSGGGGRAWMRLLAAAVAACWARSWRALALAWPRFRPLLSYAGRLHLALFYAYGAYYSLANRLAGIRYSLSMRPLQGRPTYAILGALLGLQLAVVAALQARAALRNIRRRSATAAATAKRRGRGGGGEAGGGEEQMYAREDETAVFLEYDDDELPYDDEWDEQPRGGAVPSAAVAAATAAAEPDGAGAGAASVGGCGGGEGGWTGGARGPAGGSNGGRSNDSGGAAVEGWEEVERLDEAGGSGWEADVFGVKSAPATRPQLTLPPPPQQQQQQQPEVDGAGPDGGEQAKSRAPPSLRGGEARRRQGSGGGGVLPVLTSLRQCPLCLSAKSHPTSTPCGHTFCWGCITTWCVEKPECPLCRSAVQLPQLVALYHTNC